MCSFRFILVVTDLDVSMHKMGQILRYFFTNHTSHNRGTSMKGPTSPSTDPNRWEQYCSRLSHRSSIVELKEGKTSSRCRRANNTSRWRRRLQTPSQPPPPGASAASTSRLPVRHDTAKFKPRTVTKNFFYSLSDLVAGLKHQDGYI
jgi:hypothetical protein